MLVVTALKSMSFGLLSFKCPKHNTYSMFITPQIYIKYQYRLTHRISVIIA